MQPQMAKKWQKKFTFRAVVINQIRPTSIGNPSIFFFQLEELGRSVRLLLSSVVASEGINFHFRTCIAHHLPLPATASGTPLKPSSAGLTSKPASLYKLGVIGKILSGKYYSIFALYFWSPIRGFPLHFRLRFHSSKNQQKTMPCPQHQKPVNPQSDLVIGAR